MKPREKTDKKWNLNFKTSSDFREMVREAAKTYTNGNMTSFIMMSVFNELEMRRAARSKNCV